MALYLFTILIKLSKTNRKRIGFRMQEKIITAKKRSYENGHGN